MGIAPSALPQRDKDHLDQWLAQGHHGTMSYMSNPLRQDIRNVYPKAQSVISLGLFYHHESPYDLSEPDRGRISSYAWGTVDYHDLMKERLLALAKLVEIETNQDCEVAVDSFPIYERAYGHQAGLGWVGKNACLIHQGKGSFFFLGEVVSQAKMVYDTPPPDRCGTCRACIDACPTDALIEPFQLDARLCISYLTIEFRGKIESNLSEKMENLIFGCDICQDVCPWNRQPPPSQHASFQPREDFTWKLDKLAPILEGGFKKLFGHTPVDRTRRRGFMRNLIIAVENSGLDYADFLHRAAQDGDEIVQWHARRALKIL